ncbi:MAG: hypothetical protein ACF8MF_12805 [Phycisphaerales bacterium JB052]
MAILVSFYLIGLAILLAGYVLVQVVRGDEELVSLRNFFIAGLIVFQITGPALSIQAGDVGYFMPADLDSSSIKFGFMITVFTAIFLFTYKRSSGLLDKFYARKAGDTTAYSPLGMLVIAGMSLGLGLFCQYVLFYIPVLGPGFFKLAFGLYAIGAGLAAWTMAPRLMNPIYLFGGGSLIMVSAGLTFAGNFGRREILGVVLAILWAMYFSHWRNLGFKSVIARISVVCIGGLILLGLVTSARSGDFREQSAMQNISTLKSASAGEGVKEMLYGQRAGLNSMWLIESRPDSHDYDTLHTLKLMIGFPIPRAVWLNKPDALGITMPKLEIKVPGKPKGWNIGPGIIGHIANDNPFIALWLYPIIIGFVFRIFDRAVMWFSTNPFVVLPMGAAIGQVIGMPRGELGNFFFTALLNVVAAFVIMRSISFVLSTIGWIKKVDQSWDDAYIEQEEEAWDAAHGWDEYQGQYGDGEEGYTAQR